MTNNSKTTIAEKLGEAQAEIEATRISETEVLGISMEDWYGGFAKIEKICQEPKKE
jgi:hypothetical protein